MVFHPDSNPIRPAIPETLGDRAPDLIAAGMGAFRPTDRERLATLVHDGRELMHSIVGLYRSGLIVPNNNGVIAVELIECPAAKSNLYFLTLTDTQEGSIGEQLTVTKIEAVHVLDDQADEEFHRGAQNAGFDAHLASQSTPFPAEILERAVIENIAAPYRIALTGNEALSSLILSASRPGAERRKRVSRNALDQYHQLERDSSSIDVDVIARSNQAGISGYAFDLIKRVVKLNADHKIEPEVRSSRPAKRSDLLIATEILSELSNWARDRLLRQDL